MHLVLHRERHDPVPGRIELDLVDAVAVAVVRAQLGRLLVRARAERQGLGASAQRGEGADPLCCPAGALTLEPLAQRRIDGEEVDVREGRRLVLDLVSAEAIRLHERSIAPRSAR